MYLRRLTSLLVAALFCTSATGAQPVTQSDPQAVALANQALAALVGTTVASDVTLTGTATRIAGSDNETGTAVLKALAPSYSRLDLSFPSGSRSEVRGTSQGVPGGNWFGPDGAVHEISYHNLMTDASWFFPAFTLGDVFANQSYVVSYVGLETRNGQSVQHLSAYAPSNAASATVATLSQHLSQMDIYLDSTTSLPAALVFNIHPDNDAGLDILIEIDFSNYQAVNGVQIPFHIQKLLNNGLALDLQFQTAAINTGLTASTFALQ